MIYQKPPISRSKKGPCQNWAPEIEDLTQYRNQIQKEFRSPMKSFKNASYFKTQVEKNPIYI